MGWISWPRPVVTAEKHRPTLFEVFFDLVLVFGLIRVTTFMSERPSSETLTQGLLVLVLLWNSWLVYAWLGNYVRLDVGLTRAGVTVAMAAVFLIALVIPEAWQTGPHTTKPRLILVLAYVVVRVIDSALFHWAAADDPRLSRTVRLYALTTALSWLPLVLGAVLGGTAQLLLWAAALIVDMSGGVLALLVSGWPVRSPGHFVERHGLVVIIALGESLISVGAGIGTRMIRTPTLVAALLTLVLTICLYWLYSANTAHAERALTMAPGLRRGFVAGNAYSVAHLPLLAGTIYVALGVEEVLAALTHEKSHATLNWAPTIALFGGAALYLVGRAIFLGLSGQSVRLEQYVAPGLALLLLPVGRYLPGLAALGLLTAFLVALLSYEAWTRRSATNGGAQ
ncbi:low temperature requirement protein A [Micromonospora sp. NPDC049171]|uniref:low temperature requirement protein A n=1 Tax=Micromonospora sp. NPDC049171 TaxID=3155770 RepID=UPI0033E88B9A